MTNPSLYYNHNVIGTINLLNWCVKNGVKNFLFASTAGVYGNVLKEGQNGYIESDAGNPFSIYGKTKLMCEQIINDYSKVHEISGYIFRFFNVCGGSELNHGSPIHLLPLIVDRLINKKDVCIFGNDYNTKDGTCVRDYIHLNDISNAFIMAIEREEKELPIVKVYNLGSNEGYTVKEIINKTFEIFERLYPGTKDKIRIIEKERRAGDFDSLVANSDLIKKELGWESVYTLEEMITDTIKDFKLNL